MNHYWLIVEAISSVQLEFNEGCQVLTNTHTLPLSHTHTLFLFSMFWHINLFLSLSWSLFYLFLFSFVLPVSLSLIISVSPLSLFSVCHLSVSLFVLHFSHFFSFSLPLSLFSAASRSLFPVFLRWWRQTQKVDVDWKPFLLRSLICFETDPHLSLFPTSAASNFFLLPKRSSFFLSLSLSLTSHRLKFKNLCHNFLLLLCCRWSLSWIFCVWLQLLFAFETQSVFWSKAASPLSKFKLNRISLIFPF